MYALMKAELLKQKHSFHKKLVWLAPIVTIFIAIILMGGGYIQSGSYNWWYTIILPASLTIISSLTIVNEQKGKFHGLFSSLVHIKKLWYSKIIVCTLYLALTCLTFFIGITLSGVLFGSQISLIDSFIASLILFILFAWQIPLWMYLSMKVNISFSVILSLICNFGIAVIFAVKTVWWIPFAIPARLMCSIIGILPNGLNVDGGSYLLNDNVIPVGIFINVTLYVVLSYLTAKCFEKQEV
ncbi:lantibiotic immunity ABC transporter MutE/EpiE family permease subunit [Clostridium tarantellae]|nr:lantibiotic immunity ABC transporter MutE/EpiE family permease subunit [Clostridium tarantellae]